MIDLTQKRFIYVEVYFFEYITIFAKVLSLLVIVLNRLPVRLLPRRIANNGFIYLLIILTLYFHRYCKPAQSIGSFNFISVSPISTSILHIIKEYKLINHMYEIEVTFPGNIIGLNYCHFFCHELGSTPIIVVTIDTRQSQQMRPRRRWDEMGYRGSRTARPRVPRSGDIERHRSPNS